MLARGETPFLHAFANNAGAIALCEKFGFLTRWHAILMAFKRVLSSYTTP
jgi:predicted GNAT family acetyltransferase